MWTLLRHALTALVTLPSSLQHLSQFQHETNSLLRELIIAITTQPAETPRSEPPSPVGLPPIPLMDPQPMPSPRSTGRKLPYTDRHVFVQTPAYQLAQDAQRAAHQHSAARAEQRIVPANE